MAKSEWNVIGYSNIRSEVIVSVALVFLVIALAAQASDEQRLSIEPNGHSDKRLTMTAGRNYAPGPPQVILFGERSRRPGRIGNRER
jgi:hypothetical protein